MARPLRLIVPGCAHAISLKGLNRQPVFLDDEDHLAFLATLRDLCKERRLALHGYCLLPTQVLLLLTPADEAGIGRAMQSLGRRYGATFNRRHGRSGGLWDGRFRATVVEDAQVMAVLRHIEQRPLTDGVAQDLLTHPWSSLPHHLGLRTDPHLVAHARYWALGNTPFEREAVHRRWMDEPQGSAAAQALARRLDTGGLLGGPDFVRQLEQQVQRPLSARPRGRPRKPVPSPDEAHQD